MCHFHRVFQCLCYTVIPLTTVCFIVGASWLMAGILEFYSNNRSVSKTQADHHTIIQNIEKTQPNGFPNKIFTFLQISDIHISQFRDYGQVKDLQKFCESSIMKQIQPSVAIITGDLTDAKDKSNLGSEQYPIEWKTYISILDLCKQLTPTTKWLDIPGNHDAFKVSGDKNNYYLRYSENKDLYAKTGVSRYSHITSFGLYEFIGIDFTPIPGPGRPFNFFGIPKKETLKCLKSILTTESMSNATIWYGHYPISTTTLPQQLRKLLSKGVAYLCGHLHTLLNFVPTMHAVHREQFMELELGDWKENRRFRVGVFDHDKFSFADSAYPLVSPIIIFTNPIDARYTTIKNSHVPNDDYSTHVRLLVYWNEPIQTVEISINNRKRRQAKKFGNFFSCKWNPREFSSGINRIHASVMDWSNRTFHESIEFSLDGTRVPLGFKEIILLMTDFITIMQFIYLLTIFSTTILMYLLKRYSHKYKVMEHMYVCINGLSPQFGFFLSSDFVFWLVFVYNIYIAFGPFSIGFFEDNVIGVAFPYGIYTCGHFLTGSLTFLYVSQQLLLFNATIVLYFGEHLRMRVSGGLSLKSIIKPPHKSISRCRVIFFNLILLLYVCYSLREIRMFYIAYGMMAALCNPLLTGSILFILCLCINSKNL